MKKHIVIMSCVLFLGLVACAKTSPEQADKAQAEQTNMLQAEQTDKPQAEQTTPDADWILPETIDMTDDARELFNNAMNGLVGVNYEPLGLMGEKDGVYCILCRAAVVYPDAKPYYALVYVNDQGVQNIWDIWMGAHAEKK